MKYPITQTILTPELKTSIYKDFAKNAIESVGFDGLAQDPVALQIVENDLSLGVWANYFGATNLSNICSHIKSIVARV